MTGCLLQSLLRELAESSANSVQTITRFLLPLSLLADFLDEVRPKIDQFAELLNREIGRCPDYAGMLSIATDELNRLAPAGRR